MLVIPMTLFNSHGRGIYTNIKRYRRNKQIGRKENKKEEIYE